MKTNLRQKLGVLGVSGALAVGGLVLGAAPATAAPCGFFNAGVPSYNHCGTGKVKIRVDKIFGNHTQCVGPGITRLDIPSGNRVKNAYYIGRC